MRRACVLEWFLVLLVFFFFPSSVGMCWMNALSFATEMLVAHLTLPLPTRPKHVDSLYVTIQYRHLLLIFMGGIVRKLMNRDWVVAAQPMVLCV